MMLPKKAEHPSMDNVSNAMVSEYDNASRATVRFVPKKYFGQWMLRKATIELCGRKETIKIKQSAEFQVDAAEVSITCYGNYFGKIGRARKVASLQAGKTYEVRYHTPLLIFIPGKLEIIACT